MQKDRLKLDKFFEVMKDESFPVFGTDIQPDERDANDSFFIYADTNVINRGSNSTMLQFLKRFTLAFVTKVDDQVDVIALADKLTKCGLTFDHSDFEVGEMEKGGQDSGIKASMTTMYFNHAILVVT